MSERSVSGLKSKLTAAAFVAAAVSLSACGPAAPSVPLGPLKGTFAVSDYFTPSGHMGDGQELGFVYADIQTNCKERPEGARGYCYNFTYLKRGPQFGWAGVFWVYPANNWGSREGIRVEDPKAYKQVRFKAASDVPVFLQAFFGGITDAFLPYMDQVKGFGGGMTTKDWQQFRMEVFHDDAMPLTNLIGAFGWAIRYPDGSQQSPPHYPNGDHPVNIYIDDIVWDTEPLPSPLKTSPNQLGPIDSNAVGGSSLKLSPSAEWR